MLKEELAELYINGKFNGVNPFSEEYYLEQLSKFKIKNYKKNNVEVLNIKLKLEMRDNYLYKEMYEQTKEAPVLCVESGEIMGLSRLEVEAHFMPIYLAEGKVGVGGLGIGYYVKSILDKPEVTEVIVYELNKEIIEYYYETFGENEKLTILNEEVLNIKSQAFDFFYMDIYDFSDSYKAIDDMKVMKCNNNIKTYHFWGIEAVIQASISELSLNTIACTQRHIQILIERYFGFIMILEGSKNRLDNHLDGKEAVRKLLEI